jgi:1-Cys peroxiredoxin 6
MQTTANELEAAAGKLGKEATTIVVSAVQNIVSEVKQVLRTQGTLNLGETMPNFEAESTQGKIKLHEYFGDSWGILFSHPADFTPVCTTELNLVLQFLPEFTKRNCKVVALSCDPVESHMAWCQDVVAYSDQTKGSNFTYPIIADPNREIAKTLGMLDAVAKDAAGIPLTARAVFICGPDKTLKLSILYPATTGRNFTEIIRVIDSLQLTAQRKLATPADWEAGQDCIVSTAVSQEDAPKLFPAGVRIVDLPSKKPYLRFTPDPRDGSAPSATAPVAAAAASAVARKAGLNLGDELPNFEAETTYGKIKFHEFIDNSWAVLFSHPADFTPVCTTELSKVAMLDPQFKDRGVKVICISCDPVDSHIAWSQDVLAYGGMGEQPQLPFPIIADPSRNIATTLGMLDGVSKDAAGLPNTCRAVFVIGPDRKLKLSILYPATTGRNFNEVLRVIDSLQLTATRRLATPGNWIPGQDCIIAPSVSTAEATTLFPLGVRIVDLPSQKQYLRFTPDPRGVEEQKTGNKPSVSAADWARSDEQLQADAYFKTLHERYSMCCSEASLQRAVAALEAEKHIVKVFNTSQEAVDYMGTLLTDKVSVSTATSTTLEQIGWIAYLKTQDSRINNLKGKAAKAAAEGNQTEHASLIQQGALADLFFTGVGAISETGQVIAGDLSGSRVSGWLAAKTLVMVTGSNKIVSDFEEAKTRLHEYQLRLESARVRVAYKVPASALMNEVALTAANPMGPRTIVVIIKESLGF